MAVDDVIGIQIHGRYQQQNIVNIMHYKITDQVADDHAILTILCDAWETAFKVLWLARHVDTYSLMGLKGFSLTGDNKAPGLTHIDEPGTVVTDEAPSVICRTITLYTDSDNYRRRGRVMLSGSSEAMFNDSDGAVTLSEIGLLTQFASGLIGSIGTGGDAAQAGLAPTAVLPFEAFTHGLGRKTPSVIRSRRVRGFSIG